MNPEQHEANIIRIMTEAARELGAEVRFGAEDGHGPGLLFSCVISPGKATLRRHTREATWAVVALGAAMIGIALWVPPAPLPIVMFLAGILTGTSATLLALQRPIRPIPYATIQRHIDARLQEEGYVVIHDAGRRHIAYP